MRISGHRSTSFLLPRKVHYRQSGIRALRAEPQVPPVSGQQTTPGDTEGQVRSTRTVSLTLADVFRAGGSSKTVLVGVMGRYSNSTQQMNRIKRTLALVGRDWPVREEAKAPLPNRLEHRLTSDQVDALVTAYAAGATGHQLAERFGLAKSSVIVVLRDQGVEIRRPRMSPADCAEVALLYRQGMRQVDIAKRFGRDKGHIWHVLRRAGLV